METVQYLRAFARSWWLILLTVIAGGLGGYLAYHGETPLYRSSIRMIVATTTGGLDEVAARTIAGQRADVLAQVAPTPPAVQDAVIAANEVGHAQGLATSANANGPFVTVTVTSPDPHVANAVANAYADTLEPSTLRLAGPTSTPLKLTPLAPASLELHPYAPKPKHDVGLGLAAGLVLGLALAILRQTFNSSVRDSDELQELTGLTVLGTVPRDLPKKPLPSATDPRSARAEAYRQVRTTLLNHSDKRPMTISVTSATLGEGKTTVACNLAVAFSRGGYRVALIDADLRRPQVDLVFGLDRGLGLTEVLSGTARLEEALSVFDGGRLAILSSGRLATDPSEVLDSQAMKDVLSTLAGQYEFVIIDTPPVLPVTDALVLAPQTDGVVLVVRLDRTTRNRVKHAMSSVERVNGVFLGVVPNQAGKGRDVDYRYPYKYTAARRKTKNKPRGVAYGALDQSEFDAPIVAAPAQPEAAPPSSANSDDELSTADLQTPSET